MAKIVLGMWTTHGPTLGTSAEQWPNRIAADKKRVHPFRGKEYSFDQLVEMRKGEGLALPILLLARPLADEQQLGVRVTHPEDDLSPGPRERASRAAERDPFELRKGRKASGRRRIDQ